MSAEEQTLGNLQNLGGSSHSSPGHDDLARMDANSPSKNSREQGNHISTANKVEPTTEKTNADAQLDDPYAHIPPHQAELLKRQLHTPETKRGVGVLYRYCSREDLMILSVSSLCSIASGAAMPLMTVLFGNLQGVFQDYFNGATTYDHFQDRLVSFVLYLVYLGIGEFVVTYVATIGFIYTGERITARIREHYLECCLRQNIAFFDNVGAGEITTHITSNTNLIQDGISQKVSTTLAAVATITTAFVIGFINYWKLTLILISTVAAWMLNMSLVSRLMLTYNKQSLGAYAQGGSLAGEVITSIRNTVAFGAQDHLAKQYDGHLAKAEHYGFRFQSTVGLMVASLQLIMFLSYALAFWQGSKFLLNGEVSLSKVLTVMMAVMVGAFTIGNVAPNIQAFMAAIAAAAKIFDTIERKSPIDPNDATGEKLDSVVGNLRLENIQHRYPSRPEVLVMNNVSLDIPAGKTTALVGMSGSSKSTIIGLIERFYLPIEGAIYLDGHDISTLNLKWLRQQMALVSQEPSLFGTTIFHNIRHGLVGTRFDSESDEAQRRRVISAAKKAFAHEFITNFQEGYDTNVGERGFLLSGGQKQRIAIARAIVSDPKILFLDEATSALDTKSEGVVQAALDAASEGRTTITIAHRLSTIRDADNIVVMQNGCIVEQGTHNNLLTMNGAYCKLVSAQSIMESFDQSSSHSSRMDEKDHRNALNAEADQEDDVLAATQSRSKKEVGSSQQKRNMEQEKQYSLWSLIKLILSFNVPEWKLMVAGFLFSIICGGGNSTAAVFFAKQISTLSRPTPPNDPHDIKHNSDFWSGMYVMLAFVLSGSYCGQGIAFALCSERLIHRVRDRAFRTMLRQDVAYFDRDENTAGALTSFLSTETTHLAGLSGAALGNVLNVCTTLIVACTLSLAIGWELALVCIATMPVLIACGFFHFWMLAHFQRHSKAAYSASASFASEAVSAIRTVASLTREDDVLKEYHDALVAQQRRSLVFVSRSTVLYAASQSLIFFCFALGFWYGGTLLGKHKYDQFQFFLCFMAIIFGAQSAGLIFSRAPDMGKAHSAASELKSLFDRRPLIDTWAEGDRSVEQMIGRVEFRDVHFKYPTRPDQPVLNGLNLNIRSGQYVALVGASGCGKSTAIALLERFYDPVSGSILVDGVDIKTLDVNNYRAFLALVSQEPTLYQGTIRENIVLGSSESNVTDEVLHLACRDANIYDFIISLPNGFNTVVGSKGGLLSGGQKQRIAIARALVRNPRILLLDEATSALDSESEHVVQVALDKAAKGRTTIAVAHRLSTIQKADVIYVFDQGRAVETGTHAELMGKNGRYAELVRLQSLAKD